MSTHPLPLVDSSAAIAELETQGDAIIIAQDDKIVHLNDLSLEGDIENKVSDIVEAQEKALFTRN
jgi:DhnA family fructose-bisphosphate aldolase class Ia